MANGNFLDGFLEDAVTSNDPDQQDPTRQRQSLPVESTSKETGNDGHETAGPIGAPTQRVLLDHHREHLYESGLTDVEKTGIYSVMDSAEAAKLLGWQSDGPAPAIAFPVFGLDGQVVQTVLRPDNPRTRKDGSVAKYEQPLGEAHRVWFPPPGLIDRDRLLDVTQPIVITEGIKKALALTQVGRGAISMQGVSVWHDAEHREEHKGEFHEWILHPDLKQLPLKGRTVYIAFDGGDTTDNPPVILAEARTARLFMEQGAHVYLLRIPYQRGGPKVGVDDYLAGALGPERAAALEGLVAEAVDADLLTRLEAVILGEEADRRALALVRDPSFAAALRVGGLELEGVAKKRLGKVGIPVGAVDEAKSRFAAALGARTDLAPEATAPLGLADPEPASAPQDSGELLAELTATFNRYLMLPDLAAIVLALWVMHTWAFGNAEFTPRLGITSPARRCGKTRLLDLLTSLCRRALSTSNISAAALYRTVEIAQPTLLIDEADAFLRDNEELRGVLNAGYRLGGSVLRCVGDDNEPTSFSCFAPAAIAAIGQLPNTIEDRALIVRLQRKPKSMRLPPVKRKVRKALEALRPRLARWAKDCAEELSDAQVEAPEALNDRQAEIVEPLLAIAERAGQLQEAKAALVAICGAEAADSSDRNERLLRAVWHQFNPTPSDVVPEFLTLKAIVRQLVGDETGGWDTSGRGGKPITTANLAKWLRAFGLAVRQSRKDASRDRGYFRSDVEPLWAQYGDDPGPPGDTMRDGVTPEQPQGDSRDHKGVTPIPGPSCDSSGNSNGENDCHAVTPAKGGEGPISPVNDDIERTFAWLRRLKGPGVGNG